MMDMALLTASVNQLKTVLKVIFEIYLKLLTYSPFSDRPTRQQHVLLPTSWHLYLHSATGRQPFFIVIELEDYKAYHFQRCLIPLRILLDRCWFHLDQPYRTGPR